MATLNFPDPAVTQTYEAAGITWTWNATLGVWSAEGGTGFDETVADARYLRVDAAAGDQERVSGEATFAELTTHEAGVSVTGGTAVGVGTGFYSNGTNSLQLAINGVEQMRSFNGSSTQFRFGVGGSLDTTSSSIFNAQFLYNGTGHGNQSLTNIHSKVTSDTGITGSSNKVAAIAAAVDNQTGTGIDVIGVESAVETSNAPNGSAYNFYASGSAPNYFAGDCSFFTTDVTDAAYLGIIKSSNGRGSLWARTGKVLLGTDADQDLVTLGGANAIKLEYFKSQFSGNFNDLTSPIAQFIRSGGTSTQPARAIEFYRDSAYSGAIMVTSTDVSFAPSNDYRLKSNIVDLPSSVDLIKQLKPRKYTIKGVPNKIGFVAHELQEVVPDAVFGTKDGEEAVGTLTDAAGVVTADVPEPEAMPYGESWTATGTRPVYQGVDQTKLIPLLTKALQEALERIEALEAAAGS